MISFLKRHDGTYHLFDFLGFCPATVCRSWPLDTTPSTASCDAAMRRGRSVRAETQTQGAREWAIQVIEKFSGQPFSSEAKSELLKYKLDFEP
jgi:hypothetical protein